LERAIEEQSKLRLVANFRSKNKMQWNKRQWKLVK